MNNSVIDIFPFLDNKNFLLRFGRRIIFLLIIVVVPLLICTVFDHVFASYFATLLILVPLINFFGKDGWVVLNFFGLASNGDLHDMGFIKTNAALKNEAELKFQRLLITIKSILKARNQKKLTRDQRTSIFRLIDSIEDFGNIDSGKFMLALMEILEKEEEESVQSTAYYHKG